MSTATETDKFWENNFGDSYHIRNDVQAYNNYIMFKKIFEKNNLDFNSFIEFGAGIGQNITAIKKLKPDCSYTGLEINASACAKLKTIDGVNVIQSSIKNVGTFDMVLCKGILIHIHPDKINDIYKIVYESSNKYILLCEYYNPNVVEVKYRGHAGKLWKRDFFGDIKKLYPDITLVDYGFISKYDRFPQDDITYFLIKK